MSNNAIFYLFKWLGIKNPQITHCYWSRSTELLCMVCLPSMATSLLATIYNSLSLGNILLLLLLLFILHYLKVLYEFRNMPPGPRLTTLPVLGNIFSLDSKSEKFSDAFRRSVQIESYFNDHSICIWRSSASSLWSTLYWTAVPIRIENGCLLEWRIDLSWQSNDHRRHVQLFMRSTVDCSFWTVTCQYFGRLQCLNIRW